MALALQLSGLANVAQGAALTRYYFPGCGPISAATAESQRQIKCRIPFLATKLFIKVVTNDRATSTLRFRKNTANGVQTVSITGSTTGNFEDLSGADTVADSDLYCYQLDTGSGGSTFTFSALSHLADENVTNTTVQFLAGFIGVALGSTDIVSVNGQQGGGAVDGVVTRVTALEATFKKFQVLVSGNSRNGDCTAVFRHNAGDALTITLTSATTGYFEDVSTEVAAVFEDTVYWSLTRGGTSGNCTVQYCGVHVQSPDREFHLIASGGLNSHGPSTSTYYPVMGSVPNGSTTETDSRVQARMPMLLGYLRTYVQTNTISATSSMMLRVNGADSTVSVSIDASTTGEFLDLTPPAGALATSDLCVRVTTGGSGTALAFRNFQLSVGPQTELRPPIILRHSNPRFFTRSRRYI